MKTLLRQSPCPRRTMAKQRSNDSFYGLSEKDLDFLDRKLEAILPTGDKEYRKSFAGIFDDLTLKSIFRLFQSEHLEDFEFPIATGKEADVFACVNKEGKMQAIKIFRTNTTGFKNMMPYIEGDRRFTHLRKGIKNISKIWAKKEFKNLSRFHAAGVRVPEPIHFRDSIIIMDYVGNEERAAPDLRSLVLVEEEWNAIYEVVKDSLYKAYREAELVHADLSEYNILYWEGEVYIIDVGQAVLTTHPHAEEFLRRDVKNLARFFSKKGVAVEEEDLWNWLHEGMDED